MLVIRLSRTGRTKRPNYRLVVAEKSAPVKGRFLEVIGNYDPRTKELAVNVEAAKARIAQGAQPSETAGALLEKAGVLKRPKLAAKHRRPTRATKNPSEAVAAPAAAPVAEAEAPSEDTAESAPEAASEEPAAEEPAADDAPTDESDTKDAKEETA